MQTLQIIAGFVTGTMVGLTGVGGGALMTPLLLLLFGTAPMTAVGTDLWFAALTKIAATRIHSHHGLIDWGVVRRLWVGSLPASAAALVWLHFHPMGGKSLDSLKLAIAGAVVFTAAGILLQRRLHNAGQRLRVTQAEKFKAAQGPATVVAGAIIGLLVTFTSVGAGAIGVVFLAYLYPLRLTPPRLIASDIVHAVPLTMFAGMGHLLIGHVDFALLGTLLIGSVPGVMVGAMLSSRLPHGVLRTALAVVLTLVGLKLWWSVAG
jgi:uncharacterized membrane protein YfcA